MLTNDDWERFLKYGDLRGKISPAYLKSKGLKFSGCSIIGDIYISPTLKVYAYPGGDVADEQVDGCYDHLLLDRKPE